jgi:hypothetical protein
MTNPRADQLEGFFAALCEHFNDYGELDYSDFLDLGEKHGLLEQVKYDPEQHGEVEDAEAGDMIFVPVRP